MSEARLIASVVQTLGLIAAVFVLTLSVITTPPPAPTDGDPLRLRWRTATEQEQRDYEIARLHDALTEWASQQ